jgi:hypothetical protein
MIKAQTDQGISIHQSLTNAFEPMTILHQSQQFRVPAQAGSSLEQQGRVDATQSLSEHETLNAVRQALQQRENLPILSGPKRCFGCGLGGHFASSCPDKVGGILTPACMLFIMTCKCTNSPTRISNKRCTAKAAARTAAFPSSPSMALPFTGVLQDMHSRALCRHFSLRY